MLGKPFHPNEDCPLSSLSPNSPSSASSHTEKEADRFFASGPRVWEGILLFPGRAVAEVRASLEGVLDQVEVGFGFSLFGVEPNEGARSGPRV